MQQTTMCPVIDSKHKQSRKLFSLIILIVCILLVTLVPFISDFFNPTVNFCHVKTSLGLLKSHDDFLAIDGASSFLESGKYQ